MKKIHFLIKENLSIYLSIKRKDNIFAIKRPQHSFLYLYKDGWLSAIPNREPFQTLTMTRLFQPPRLPLPTFNTQNLHFCIKINKQQTTTISWQEFFLNTPIYIVVLHPKVLRMAKSLPKKWKSKLKLNILLLDRSTFTFLVGILPFLTLRNFGGGTS